MPISRFETVAQRLLEGSFKRLFGGYVEPQEIASRLAWAMEDGADSGKTSPDRFTVILHPHDYAYLRQLPDLEAELAAYVTRLGQQTELHLDQRPLIHIIPNEKMKRHQLQVTAVFQDPSGSITQVQPARAIREDIIAAVVKSGAFLVINGRKTHHLQKPTITVGRRSENDIVLSAAAVSRQHAQLRWRYGRFILYDLTNRGRTAVNGTQTNEWPLQSGDVINISGQTLIYGEEKRSAVYAD